MIINNFVDISEDLIKNSSWNGVLLFWGVITSSKSGMYTLPFKNSVILDSMVGEMLAYIIGSFELKANMTVFCGFINSPIAKAGFNILLFSLTLVVKTVGLVAVSYCFRPLCFNLKRRTVMPIIETKSTNRKAIILLFSNDLHDEIKQKKLTNSCAHNNLEIIKTIKTNRNYDPNIFCKLIEIIKEHDQPITIMIDEYSYATYSQVMTCCVLGTLAMTKIVNICTYWESTETKDFRLHFNKEPFNFLLVAEEFLAQLLFRAKKELVKDAMHKNNGGK